MGYVGIPQIWRQNGESPMKESVKTKYSFELLCLHSRTILREHRLKLISFIYFRSCSNFTLHLTCAVGKYYGFGFLNDKSITQAKIPITVVKWSADD